MLGRHSNREGMDNKGEKTPTKNIILQGHSAREKCARGVEGTLPEEATLQLSLQRKKRELCRKLRGARKYRQRKREQWTQSLNRGVKSERAGSSILIGRTSGKERGGGQLNRSPQG